MGAIEELQLSGRLDGPDTFRLMQASLITEARKIPALSPQGSWTREDLDDLFQDFLAAKLVGLTDGLVAAATTEAAVGRMARKVAKHWLIDRVRTTTDAGSIRHTIEKLLAEDERFARSPGLPQHWSLLGAAAVSTVPVSDLVVAARTVSDVPPGRAAGEHRRASLAPLADLARVIEAVLERADGAVEIAVLTHVTIVRFDAAFEDWEVAYDDVPHGDVPVSVDRSEPSERRIEVQRVLDALTDREIRIPPFLDDQTAIQAELGVGRGQASVLNGRLRVVLAGLAPEVDDEEQFVIDLVAVADELRTDYRSVRLPETNGAAGPERSSS